jgi:hypothetical protein
MTWLSRLLHSALPKAPGPGPALPGYKALEQRRLTNLRRDFSALENSPQIGEFRLEHMGELLHPARRPAEDKPLLTSLLAGPSGVFTLTLPDAGPCMLTFSTPLRAGEYARLRGGRVRLSYLSSTPQEFFHMLGDLRSRANIQRLAVDVCPHCISLNAIEIASIRTSANIVEIWAVHKSGELARERVYFANAQEAARRGDFPEAREVTLEAMQHVSLDSARLHLLLGKIALSLKEKETFREALAFLEFLKAKEATRELLAAEATGDVHY